MRKFIQSICFRLPLHWFFYRWFSPYTWFVNWLWQPEIAEYKDAARVVLERLKKEREIL